jgi:hypothetical protein
MFLCRTQTLHSFVQQMSFVSHKKSAIPVPEAVPDAVAAPTFSLWAPYVGPGTFWPCPILSAFSHGLTTKLLKFSQSQLLHPRGAISWWPLQRSDTMRHCLLISWVTSSPRATAGTLQVFGSTLSQRGRRDWELDFEAHLSSEALLRSWIIQPYVMYLTMFQGNMFFLEKNWIGTFKWWGTCKFSLMYQS